MPVPLSYSFEFLVGPMLRLSPAGCCTAFLIATFMTAPLGAATILMNEARKRRREMPNQMPEAVPSPAKADEGSEDSEPESGAGSSGGSQCLFY